MRELDLISILIPTRNRPNSLRNVLNSFRETTYSLSQVEFLLYIDDDDRLTCVDSIYKQFPFLNMKHRVGPRVYPLSNLYNILFSHCSGSIVGYWGDDAVMLSEMWDMTVRHEFSRFSDEVLLVYPPDTKPERDFALHGWLSRKSIETVGFLFPPYFEGQCDDRWITEVYKALGRAVCVDIKIDHRRVSESRETYRTKDKNWKSCYNVYKQQDMVQKRQEWIQKLSEVMT